MTATSAKRNAKTQLEHDGAARAQHLPSALPRTDQEANACDARDDHAGELVLDPYDPGTEYIRDGSDPTFPGDVPESAATLNRLARSLLLEHVPSVDVATAGS